MGTLIVSTSLSCTCLIPLSADEPANSASDMCVVMKEDGKWKTRECTSDALVICQLDPYGKYMFYVIDVTVKIAYGWTHTLTHQLHIGTDFTHIFCFILL